MATARPTLARPACLPSTKRFKETIALEWRTYQKTGDELLDRFKLQLDRFKLQFFPDLDPKVSVVAIRTFFCLKETIESYRSMPSDDVPLWARDFFQYERIAKDQGLERPAFESCQLVGEGRTRECGGKTKLHTQHEIYERYVTHVEEIRFDIPGISDKDTSMSTQPFGKELFVFEDENGIEDPLLQGEIQICILPVELAKTIRALLNSQQLTSERRLSDRFEAYRLFWGEMSKARGDWTPSVRTALGCSNPTKELSQSGHASGFVSDAKRLASVAAGLRDQLPRIGLEIPPQEALITIRFYPPSIIQGLGDEAKNAGKKKGPKVALPPSLKAVFARKSGELAVFRPANCVIGIKHDPATSTEEAIEAAPAPAAAPPAAAAEPPAS